MSYSGRLFTRVFTGRGQFPVGDATVSIFQRDSSGKKKLLSIQRTNASGIAIPVTIETPSPEMSQIPNQSTPFTLCDLWIEQKDYQLLIVENIQIFPNISSIQNLLLIPLSQARELPVNTIHISPQDL